MSLDVHTKLKGFIQEVNLNPFGVLFLSDIQVYFKFSFIYKKNKLLFFFLIQLFMWKIICKKNPVLFFDATGNISKDVPHQPKPYSYAMLAHDVENKCIMPLV